MAGLVTVGRQVIRTLIEDLSPHGMQLAGLERARPDLWVPITIALPHHDIEVAARVVWTDHARMGVTLAPVGTDLAALIRALTIEHDRARHGALVIVDPPSAAASLCVPLRELGYAPICADKAWDALNHLADRHPPIEIAVLAPHAFGMPASYFAAVIAAKFPWVAPIVLDTATDEDGIIAALGSLRDAAVPADRARLSAR